MPKEKKNEHKTKDKQWKRWDIHCIHPLMQMVIKFQMIWVTSQARLLESLMIHFVA